jgi:hypothetical protein
LEQSVLIDLPVNRDGRPGLQVRQQGRVFFAQPCEQLMDVAGRNLDFRYATRELPQISNQRHVSHGNCAVLAGTHPQERTRVGTGAGRLSWSSRPVPVWHQSFAVPFARASSRALSTRGGDIGRSVKRTPVALATALAMAAIGGTIGVSPTPRTP